MKTLRQLVDELNAVVKRAPHAADRPARAALPGTNQVYDLGAVKIDPEPTIELEAHHSVPGKDSQEVRQADAPVLGDGGQQPAGQAGPEKQDEPERH